MSRWLLSVGHGYSARAFAASLPEGWRVRATARTPERAAELVLNAVEGDPDVTLPPDTDPATLGQYLNAGLIAVEFPAMTDGRRTSSQPSSASQLGSGAQAYESAS